MPKSKRSTTKKTSKKSPIPPPKKKGEREPDRVEPVPETEVRAKGEKKA